MDLSKSISKLSLEEIQKSHDKIGFIKPKCIDMNRLGMTNLTPHRLSHVQLNSPHNLRFISGTNKVTQKLQKLQKLQAELDSQREKQISEKRQTMIEQKDFPLSDRVYEAATGVDKKVGLVHNIEIKKDNRRLIKLNPIIKLQNIIQEDTNY